jgi:hypothetical protein
VLFHSFAIQMNLISPLWFAIRVFRQMREQDGTGSIINISSGAGHPAGAPTLVSYGAAKAGLNHMTRSLAEEWGPTARVNCLALGPTMTDNFRSFVLPKDDPDGEKYFATSRSPGRRARRGGPHVRVPVLVAQPTSSTAPPSRSTAGCCPACSTRRAQDHHGPAMKSVIQFSTGNVGRHALQMIIERPDLRLVGLHAHGMDKVGRDAAELCGLDEPTGILATDDIDALVALEADCVLYTSQAEMRPQQAIAEISRFLRTGTNVVGTSMVWLVAPHQADHWMRDPLSKACHAGGTSLYINGVDPGFSGDSLVYTALTLAGRATAVTVSEICDYGSYDDAEFTGVSFGFGTTPDHTPIMFAPGCWPRCGVVRSGRWPTFSTSHSTRSASATKAG